jgi:hypothetical protein
MAGLSERGPSFTFARSVDSMESALVNLPINQKTKKKPQQAGAFSLSFKIDGTSNRQILSYLIRH